MGVGREVGVENAKGGVRVAAKDRVVEGDALPPPSPPSTIVVPDTEAEGVRPRANDGVEEGEKAVEPLPPPPTPPPPPPPPPLLPLGVWVPEENWEGVAVGQGEKVGNSPVAEVVGVKVKGGEREASEETVAVGEEEGAAGEGVGEGEAVAVDVGAAFVREGVREEVVEGVMVGMDVTV